MNDIAAIRAERKKLEAEIQVLCEKFQVRTGLCVTALAVDTVEFQTVSYADKQVRIKSVYVGTESI